MKPKINQFLLAICVALSFAMLASAQTAAQITTKAQAEIVRLRQEIVTAIKIRDRQMLDKSFAEDFTHTHATGQVDDKKTRLDALIKGKETIETAPADDLQIRVFGDNTAVANGKCSLKNDFGEQATYRYTIVYARLKQKWQVVASQAAKIN